MLPVSMGSLLSYAFAAYLVVTGIFIIAENRRPSATFAWMMLFALLPGAGVVVYLLFGRKVFGQTRRLAQQDLTNRLKPVLERLEPEHRAAMEALAREGEHDALIAQLIASTSLSHVSTGNRVELLRNADAAYPALFEDLKRARHSIHLQYFSWGSDELCEGLKDVLAQKVAEGVTVRILYDPLGSLTMLKRSYLREMRAAGIMMRPLSKLWRIHTISYRNHRKIAVIDGLVGHTGGLNIGGEHLEPPPGFDLWRDTNVRIEGTAVSLLQAVFVTDWRNATDEDILTLDLFPEPPADLAGARLPVQMALSGPDSRWASIRQLYFAMITNARERICLQSPFFILDDTIAEALKTAALQGVDVRIMISERGTGQFLPYWAANTYLKDVARSGAKILLYRTGYLHAKIAAMDGRVCTIGSANIDIRSFSINYELNAVFYHEALTRAVEADFDRDALECVEFTARDYAARKPWLRFRDSLARLLSPLL